MDRRELRRFSLKSRENLMKNIEKNAEYLGATSCGFVATTSFLSREIEKRLIDKEYIEAYRELVEDFTYKLFISLMGIKFLEVNDYIEDKILTKENLKGKLLEKSFNLKLKELSYFMPGFFEELVDYEKELLDFDYSKDGFIACLINEFNDGFLDLASGGEIENMGWLHQYFNSPIKDELDRKIKGNYKVTEKDIIAKTQLFTPSWIVKYMVENSLFRLFLEGQGEEKDLIGKFQMDYYIEEAEQDREVKDKLISFRMKKEKFMIEDISLIDPAMGTGHILTYSFDVFMKIYKYLGYEEKIAGKKILERNIFGLDIDRRAAKLCYFSLMMKYREYTDSIDFRQIDHNLHYFESPRSSSSPKGLEEVLGEFHKAEELGSILKLQKDYNFNKLKKLTKDKDILKILKLGQLLNKKYDLVITNPPYLSSSNMNKDLASYCKENYKDTRRDLFAVFMDKSNELLKETGYYSMVNQHSWMFLLSYANFRERFLEENNIVSLLHLGTKAFDPGEVGTLVQSVAFVASKFRDDRYKGTYFRLLEGENTRDKDQTFLRGENKYIRAKKDFKLIENKPIAYWTSKNLTRAFLENKRIKDLYDVKQGMSTSNNKRFLRNWREVNFEKIGFAMASLEEAKLSGKKWFPYNKGGLARKWYGNHSEIINYHKDGKEIKEYTSNLPQGTWVRIKSREYYFKESISWVYITDLESFGARYIPKGFIFDVSGSSIFLNEEDRSYILGLLCSKVSIEFMKLLNPTMNFQVRDIKNIPVRFTRTYKEEVVRLVEENIKISKLDWDLYERSWDFKTNSFLNSRVLPGVNGGIKKRFESLKIFINKNFERIKKNEERLNEIFIKLYGLDGELSSRVRDQDITISKLYETREEVAQNLKNNPYIKTKEDLLEDLLSFFIGCLFGRYSLDRPGIVYAGGRFNMAAYDTFKPLDKNLIDLDSDLLIEKLKEFLSIAFPKEDLGENLDYIFIGLGYDSARDENIRSYFKERFYKSHLRSYNRLPIYFKYKSGRENAFNGLFYIHRYRREDIKDLKASLLNKLKSYKRINKINKSRDIDKKIYELEEYIEKLARLEGLEIDLDMGINHNYELFQENLGEKINLLEKI